jgi:hypothetical protein
MKYFAEIENNIVKNVFVVVEEDLSLTVDELKNKFQTKNLLLETNYEGSIRKNFAGIKYKYYEDMDAFVPPKPYNSWIFDGVKCIWKAPIEMPDSGMWVWDEESVSWKEH